MRAKVSDGSLARIDGRFISGQQCKWTSCLVLFPLFVASLPITMALLRGLAIVGWRRV
jgi:hypothetical protein